MLVSDFFENDYMQFSLYDCIRKISNLSGFKDSGSKVISVLRESNENFIKTNVFSYTVMEKTEYLHGSIEGVVQNLASDLNNFPLFETRGNFGTSLCLEPSAARYTSLRPSKNLKLMFPNKYDKIPTIPYWLVNGQQGLTVGFKQYILPRGVEESCDFILKILTKAQDSKIQDIEEPKPFIGFRPKNNFESKGPKAWLEIPVFENKCLNAQNGGIPCNFDLVSLKGILDKNNINFKDKSESDISFEISETDIPKTQKILTQQHNEFFTFMVASALKAKDSDNLDNLDNVGAKIQEFENLSAAVEKFIEIKLKDIAERQKRLNYDIQLEIETIRIKLLFINLVAKSEINLNASIKDIKKIFELNVKTLELKILKENAFEKLMNLKLLGITKEDSNNLKSRLKELLNINFKSPQEILIDEIKILKSSYINYNCKK